MLFLTVLLYRALPHPPRRGGGAPFKRDVGGLTARDPRPYVFGELRFGFGVKP
jgi:hypothetical protein